MAGKEVTVKANVVADTKGFATGLNNATKSLEKFGQKATRIGRDVSTFISLPIAAAATAALRTATAFEFAQKKISALRGGRNIDALTKSARELGASTIFTATEVSELQLSLAKLGKSNQTIQGIQRTVLQFAQAMDMQLAPAGEFLVKTMNRFSASLSTVGSETEQAAYVGNLFAAVAANTAINAEGLAASLNYVGSEAAAAGFDLADTTALLGLLADRGFDASRGGTALRRILAQLAKEGYTAEESLEVLLDETKGFSEELSQFGLRGAGPAAALGGLKDEFIKLRLEIDQADGFLQGFATTLDTSMQASLKRIAAAAEEVSISFAEAFKTEINTASANIANLLKSFSELDKGTKKTILIIGGVIVVVGALVTIVGVLAAAVGAIVAVIGSVATVIGVAVAALVSYVGISKLFQKETDASALSMEQLRREATLANKGFEDLAASKFITQDQLQNLVQYELTLGKLNQQLENQKGKNFFGVLDTQVQDLEKEIKDLTKAQADYTAELRLAVRRRKELERFLKDDGEDLNADQGYRGDTLNELLERRIKLLGQLDEARKRAKDGDLLDPEAVKKVTSEIADLEKILKLYGITFDKTTKTNKDAPLFTENLRKEFLKLNPVIASTTDENQRYLLAVSKLKGVRDNLSATAAFQLATEGKISKETEKSIEMNRILLDLYQKEYEAAEGLRGEVEPVAGLLTALATESEAAIQAQSKALKEISDLMVANAQEIKDLAMTVGQFFGTSIANALFSAAEGTAAFAESLKNNLIQALNRVLAKVLALIAAYTILAILSGGTSTVAFAAKNAIGGQNMGEFVMSGMNLGSFNKSAGPNTRTEGYISGSDLVFGTRRGATALDRIYG